MSRNRNLTKYGYFLFQLLGTTTTTLFNTAVNDSCVAVGQLLQDYLDDERVRVRSSDRKVYLLRTLQTMGLSIVPIALVISVHRIFCVVESQSKL